MYSIVLLIALPPSPRFAERVQSVAGQPTIKGNRDEDPTQHKRGAQVHRPMHIRACTSSYTLQVYSFTAYGGYTDIYRFLSTFYLLHVAFLFFSFLASFSVLLVFWICSLFLLIMLTNFSTKRTNVRTVLKHM
jgi:hypothetical protein